MKIRKKSKISIQIVFNKNYSSLFNGQSQKKFQADTSSHGVSTFKKILCLVFSTEVFNTEAKLSFAPLTIQNKKKNENKKPKMSKKTRSIRMNKASSETITCQDNIK